MKNSQLSALMRDYDYVNRALENPENKPEHIEPLRKLIVNFRKKWSDYRFAVYLYNLQEIWKVLDERLFDEKMESKRKKL